MSPKQDVASIFFEIVSTYLLVLDYTPWRCAAPSHDSYFNSGCLFLKRESLRKTQPLVLAVRFHNSEDYPVAGLEIEFQRAERVRRYVKIVLAVHKAAVKGFLTIPPPRVLLNVTKAGARVGSLLRCLSNRHRSFYP